MVSGQAPETLAPATTPRVPALSLARIRHAKRASWIQLAKFCLVGVSGYVVNLIVFFLLFNLGGVHYMLASVGAFLVAWVNNFVLNRQWTFPKGAGSPAVQAAKYMIVSLIGLAVNLVILWGLVQLGSAELLAQAIAIAAVTPITFILTRSWAFR